VGKINTTKGEKKITHQECCQRLKTDALRELIETGNHDAVVTSILRDEHYMRNIERVASPRDKQFRWRYLRKKQEARKVMPSLNPYRTHNYGILLSQTLEKTFIM